MRDLQGKVSRQTCAVIVLLLCLPLLRGQPSSASPGARVFGLTKQFSDVTSVAAASDPADSVCARAADGTLVSDPPLVSSASGVLEVTFHYQTTIDANGLARYCYIYKNASGQTEEAPTLEVNPGDQLIIHFYNDLPAASAATSGHMMHAVAVRPAASGADSACSATTVNAASTNLHFHGVNAAPVCHQDEVVHTLIQSGENFDYTVQIPANEPPGVYWYHPHPHGFSDPQVIGGATGVILVDGIETVNPVVAGLPQRVFVFRDQALPNSVKAVSGNPIPQTDLSINYVPVTYPSYTPAEIQTGPAEKEFWRVLNTSADTVVDLQVVDDKNVAQSLQIVSVDGVPLTDNDGNPTTNTVTSYVLSPATRVELIVSTPAVGVTYQMKSLGWNNGPTGDPNPARPIADIVGSASSSKVAAAGKRLPADVVTHKITRFSALDAAPIAATRTLYFSVKPNFSEFYITVDGQTPAVYNMDSMTPDVTVTEGTVEQWTIQNRSTMDHNFHMHQLHFQTLAINGTTVSDPTRRDTINIPHWSGNASDPYPSVTLLMDFRDPNIVGTFVYHCHILSHEDRGMMGMIQVLPGVTATALTASAASTPAGSSITLTATVAPTAGSGVPTGTVTFLNGTTMLGTGKLNSSGVATLDTTALPIGSNSITASYSGDTSFAASTATALPITVTAAVTATALTSSAASIEQGASVSFTAALTATAGTGIPSGTVSFLNGATTLGSGTLDASGTATYATSALPVGTASVTATYAGNSSFAASTSTAVSVVVTAPPPPDFGIAAGAGSISVAKGATGTSTITITPQNGFSAAVTFACSGLPSAATCTFSPSSVTPVGSSAAKTTISISTTAASALAHPLSPRAAEPLYALVLPGAGLLLGLGGLRRRRWAARWLGLALISLAMAYGVAACGGGSSSTPSNPGTPAGTSTVTVTATSGTTVHTTTLTLTVTQ